jgi:hypothetical protein
LAQFQRFEQFRKETVMANDERGSQKAKQPAGAVNMHKSLATGVPLQEAEAKALTKEQVEKKER